MTTFTFTTEELRSLLCTGAQTPSVVPVNGCAPLRRYVIVRGDRSGVFAGVFVSEEGRTVELTECRHIYYWNGAANTAEMSLHGVSKPGECKFLAPVARLRVLDAIEVIDCTPAAETSLRGVSVWSKK